MAEQPHGHPILSLFSLEQLSALAVGLSSGQLQIGPAEVGPAPLRSPVQAAASASRALSQPANPHPPNEAVADEEPGQDSHGRSRQEAPVRADHAPARARPSPVRHPRRSDPKPPSKTHRSASPTLFVPGSHLLHQRVLEDMSAFLSSTEDLDGCYLQVCMHELHHMGILPNDASSEYDEVGLLCEAVVNGRPRIVDLDDIKDLGGLRGIGYQHSWEEVRTALPTCKGVRTKLLHTVTFAHSKPKFNPSNKRVQKLQGKDACVLSSDPPPIVRIMFCSFPFIKSETNPFQEGNKKLCDFPRLEDLVDIAGQLVGLQFRPSTTSKCPGFSKKGKVFQCTQCRDVVINNVREDSSSPNHWLCDLMVIISPFHSDECDRGVQRDFRRNGAICQMTKSLASQGVRKDVIIDRVTPAGARDTNASADSLGLALVTAASTPAVHRSVNRVEARLAPIDSRIRSQDPFSAVAKANVGSEDSGYLAAIVPRKTPKVKDPWVGRIVEELKASIKDDTVRDGLIIFVFQSAHQRQLRDICTEIAIDSIHAFARTTADGPDQVLASLEGLVACRRLDVERYRYVRSRLRESKQLLRSLNLITVLGYVDLGQGDHKKGFPLGFALVSNERAETIQAVLKMLFPTKEMSPTHGCRIPPSEYTRVMSDAALALRKAAIGAGFSERALRLCTWHVSRALTGWANKGPSTMAQLSLSIVKFLVFGPRLSPEGLSAAVSADGDREKELMDELDGLGLDLRVLKVLKESLGRFFDIAGKHDETKRKSGRSSVRRVQDLFATQVDELVGMLDSRVSELASVPGAAAPEDATVPVENSLPETLCDGRIILQALGVVKGSVAGTVQVLVHEEGPVDTTAFELLRDSPRKVALLEELASQSFTMFDLTKPDLFADIDLGIQEGMLRDDLLDSLRRGGRGQELAFLAHWIHGAEIPSGLEDADPADLEGLELPDDSFRQNPTELTALKLVAMMRVHQCSITAIVVTTSGGVRRIELKPNTMDTASLLYVHPSHAALMTHPKAPEPGDTGVIVILTDPTFKRIEAVTPLYKETRCKYNFSEKTSFKDPDQWHKVVAIFAGYFINEVIEAARVPSVVSLETLGRAWKTGGDEGFDSLVNIALLRIAEGDVPLRLDQEGDIDLEASRWPDISLMDNGEDDDTDSPQTGKKRSREEVDSTTAAIFKELPLQPSARTHEIVRSLAKKYSERAVKSAVRKSLAASHQWASEAKGEIVKHLAPKGFHWWFRRTPYRVKYSLSQLQPQGYLRLARLKVASSSVSNAWLHSLRVEDVNNAARLLFNFGNEGSAIWENEPPAVQLVYRHAVVEIWKTSLVVDAGTKQILYRLADFTLQSCSCLALLQVYNPTLWELLETSYFKDGKEGEWSAAFYTIPVFSCRESMRDIAQAFGPTTNNALESMHKDIHAGMVRQTGSATHAIVRLPDVMLSIYRSRSSSFEPKTFRGKHFGAGEAGLGAWIQELTERPIADRLEEGLPESDEAMARGLPVGDIVESRWPDDMGPPDDMGALAYLDDDNDDIAAFGGFGNGDDLDFDDLGEQRGPHVTESNLRSPSYLEELRGFWVAQLRDADGIAELPDAVLLQLDEYKQSKERPKQRLPVYHRGSRRGTQGR